MGKIVTLSIPQKLSTGEQWGGVWNLLGTPISSCSSVAGDLFCGFGGLFGETAQPMSCLGMPCCCPPWVPRGLGDYCWQQTPRSPPDGIDMGLSFLLEPSVLGEALLTLPATTLSLCCLPSETRLVL